MWSLYHAEHTYLSADCKQKAHFDGRGKRNHTHTYDSTSFFWAIARFSRFFVDKWRKGSRSPPYPSASFVSREAHLSDVACLHADFKLIASSSHFSSVANAPLFLDKNHNKYASSNSIDCAATPPPPIHSQVKLTLVLVSSQRVHGGRGGNYLD